MLILGGHKNRVHTLAFSPDGQALASVAGRGQSVWLWDLARGEVCGRAEHDRRVVALAFAPWERPTLAFADSLGAVTAWDIRSRKRHHLGAVEPPFGQSVKVAYSPDGSRIAVTGVTQELSRVPLYRPSRPCGVYLWEMGTGPTGPVLPLPGRIALINKVGNRLVGPAGSLLPLPGREPTSLAFSPDGATLAAGALDCKVHLWDVDTHRYQAGLNHGQKVHFVTFSPDGRTLASATPGGLVKLWHAQTGRVKGTLKGQGGLHAVACSPDGRTVATAGIDGQVRFWDAETGRPLRAFDWGVGEVHSVAFAPDGMRAAAGGDGDIVVWDIDDWG